MQINAQKVRLITILSSPKLLLMLQSVLGKLAVGSPQPDVSMLDAPLDSAAGIEVDPRGQNQTLMAALVRSIAYHPPPLALKAGP